MFPTEIKRLPETGPQVTWSNGEKATLSVRTLRTNCPCAECREARGDLSHSAPLTPKKGSSLKVIQHAVDTQLKLESVWAVGNYAVGLAWGDGHNSGIFTYDYLRSLPVEPAN
jgi:ATP-binding protein involved in chromosome partitioning